MSKHLKHNWMLYRMANISVMVRISFLNKLLLYRFFSEITKEYWIFGGVQK
jgi:hypothetical protein